MRLAAIMVLLSLAAGVMVPPAPALLFAPDGMPCYGTLDVCHSAAPALASGGEMPCVNECLYDRSPVVSVTTFDQPNPLFAFFLIPSSIEKPPRS